MLTEREVGEVPVEVSRQNVLRLLGMGRRTREPRGSILVLVEEEMEVAVGLLSPRAVLARSEGGLDGSRFLDRSVPHALGICTIGPEVEERVQRLSAQGQATRAMILDAIGSAAVEAVADEANRLICDRAPGRGDLPATRRSPGYGGWDLAEQVLLFDALAPDEVGVQLTSSFMMRPGKSVSFAIPLAGGGRAQSPRSRCARCGSKSCRYREEVP